MEDPAEHDERKIKVPIASIWILLVAFKCFPQLPSAYAADFWRSKCGQVPAWLLAHRKHTWICKAQNLLYASSHNQSMRKVLWRICDLHQRVLVSVVPPEYYLVWLVHSWVSMSAPPADTSLGSGPPSHRYIGTVKKHRIPYGRRRTGYGGEP